MDTYRIQDISSEGARISIANGLTGLSAFVASINADCGKSLQEARREALRYLMQIVSEHGEAIWLVAGHSYPVQDNAMATYNRLWLGMAKGGIAFPPSTSDDGVKAISEEGVRYFGYRAVGCDDVESIESVLARFQSFLMVGDTVSDAVKMVGAGWASTGSGVPPEAFERSLEYGVPLIMLLGDFDDATAEGVLVASPDVVRSIGRSKTESHL